MKTIRNRGGKRGGGNSGNFVKLDEWLLSTEAYRSLSPISRCLLVELLRIHNGRNNGEIGLSCRQVQALIGCSKATASRAFDELIERGFIRRTVDASFQFKTGARTGTSARYALTHLPVGNELATKEFARWRPPDAQ